MAAVAEGQARRRPDRGLFLRDDDLPEAVPRRFGFAPDGAGRRREAAPVADLARGLTGAVVQALDAARAAPV